MSTDAIALWGGFSALVAGLLFIDLKLISARAEVMTVKAALLWSAMWISTALLFNLVIFIDRGHDAGIEYLTGYVIEKSLSVDNLFVFLVIFGFFAVPQNLQPKALTWGIMGALVMRLIFILVGAALLEAFHWIIFVFGGILIFTAFKLATQGEAEVHPDQNIMVRVLRKFMPVTSEFHGSNFFVNIDGKRAATPFFLTMLVLASTDLVFALDSIPAIFAITEDPFIVYTSNAFAILGLRALFFALVGVMQYFVFLKQALVAILGFVGLKMIASEWYHMPVALSLGWVFGVLAIAIIASTIVKKRNEAAGLPTGAGHV